MSAATRNAIQAVLDKHFRAYGLTYELSLVDDLVAAVTPPALPPLKRMTREGLKAAKAALVKLRRGRQ